MTHTEMRDLWLTTKKHSDEIASSSMRLREEVYRLELRLYEMEGRGHLAHAEWIRAWLAADGRCTEILNSPAYSAEDAARLHEHRPAPLTVVAVDEAGGIPCTVDLAADADDDDDAPVCAAGGEDRIDLAHRA